MRIHGMQWLVEHQVCPCVWLSHTRCLAVFEHVKVVMANCRESTVYLAVVSKVHGVQNKDELTKNIRK